MPRGDDDFGNGAGAGRAGIEALLRGRRGWMDAGGAKAKESLRVLSWTRQFSEDGTATAERGVLFWELLFNGRTETDRSASSGSSADKAGER